MWRASRLRPRNAVAPGVHTGVASLFKGETDREENEEEAHQPHGFLDPGKLGGKGATDLSGQHICRIERDHGQKDGYRRNPLCSPNDGKCFQRLNPCK